MKTKIILISVLLLPVLYILTCNRRSGTNGQPVYQFPEQLSSLGFFQGKLIDLQPAAGVFSYELSSTLFTDYAEKQRLVKLPKGQKMRINGDGTFDFPEGTRIAKTFFYGKGVGKVKKHMIETRILILEKGIWAAGSYKWNSIQTEAVYSPESSIVPLSIVDAGGKSQIINYRIPSSADCRSCHNTLDKLQPIGPKAMNLNRQVKAGGKAINQLALFKALKLLDDGSNIQGLATLPNYQDQNLPVRQRARAYLDINCAHCHNPNGMAYQQSVMLGFQVPQNQSGIAFNKENILERMGSMGPFHMPKIGTTIVDKEGFELVKAYLKEFN